MTTVKTNVKIDLVFIKGFLFITETRSGDLGVELPHVPAVDFQINASLLASVLDGQQDVSPRQGHLLLLDPKSRRVGGRHLFRRRDIVKANRTDPRERRT